ncbi:AMIN domain-containing protein [Aphanizomenon sp. CS-733/32]|uniref:type IV pilus secretin family protein n=1 Tax=Aphanizomenon sp. CS-733/32 TaxID=3021715 RepID=UPI00232D1E80|nr:type IV pilus secretin family protein [Aphanizomenon sp. CS-733/32]MDB9310054.1 AMIN domain-containing protein [Aphanizomenon sp. CS-733/32]
MKQFHNSVFVSSAAACVLLAAQPVLGQLTQITDVKLNPIEGGISVILKTAAGDRPQVFTTKKDKSLIADVINTQLRLPKGDNFRQENPAPGIKIIEVKQLDANSIRVIVTGIDDAPSNQPVIRKDNNLTLGFTTTTNSTASTATKPTEKVSAAPATTPESKPEPGKRPDVLVPNPQVTIDGKIAQSAGPNQPYNQAPPFLPRAVAPPVGDITQSNIDTSPTVIDLGTQERVPRLVLRDAPVREVLSLLARAAGLNLAYVGQGGDDKTTSTSTQNTGDTDKPITYEKISIDIENEPVQDVFNYVLRLSGLEANRSGRTIFVGTKLPNTTRDIVMRNLRLNQAKVKEVLRILVNLGAESAVSAEPKITRVTTEVIGKEEGKKSESATDTGLVAQRIKFIDSIPLLRGLQVSGDERTNTLTLIGTPKLVEMAMSQIVPLDLRRRQVVINVKIIDVNLAGTQGYNTSFSFGVGNNFFTNDGGAASFNFGGSKPASAADVSNIIAGTPTATNPLSSANIFLNQTNPTTGLPSAGINSNPTQPGLTEFTEGTAETPPKYTYSLPTLYQFPKKFLASLTAQVQSGNAKILTDPTLIVQEGQTADVQLTQDVIGDITRTVTDTPGGSREDRKITKEPIGLKLAVVVERIDDNGFVSLQVAPQVKSPAGTADTGNGQIILVSTRAITSGTIRLRDGQTLILSGIIQDQDRTTVSKLPILGDIPLLGALFRKTNRTNERREVIVLLTPQVMDDSERSSYGYNYTPSPQIRQILERRGLKVQPR